MNPIRLIPDASVVLAWLLGRVDAHESLQARHLLEVAHGSNNTVPHIWRVEVANGILRAERSQRVSEDQRPSFNQLLDRLPIFPDPRHPSSSIPRSYQLARTHGLTVYDASYLELAQRSRRIWPPLIASWRMRPGPVALPSSASPTASPSPRQATAKRAAPGRPLSASL